MAPGKRKNTKKSSKRPRKSAPSFAKKVKAAVYKLAETKKYVDYGANQDITSTSTGSVPTNRALVPLLSQNSTQYGRVGNSVQVTKATLNMRVNLKPYSLGFNNLAQPTLLKMWIVSSIVVNGNTFSASGINANTEFFDVNTTATGMQGNPLDMLLKVNRELFTVHATKTLKLGCANATAPSPTNSYTDNSSFSHQVSFNFTKALGKLLFDDSDTIPSNRNVYCVFQTCAAEGTASAGQVQAEYHFSTEICYKDC